MIDVVEQSVSALRSGLDRRAFSVRELTQAFLDRIEAMDKRGSHLNAVIERNSQALDIADRLDICRAPASSRQARLSDVAVRIPATTFSPCALIRNSP